MIDPLIGHSAILRLIMNSVIMNSDKLKMDCSEIVHMILQGNNWLSIRAKEILVQKAKKPLVKRLIS